MVWEGRERKVDRLSLLWMWQIFNLSGQLRWCGHFPTPRFLTYGEQFTHLILYRYVVV